MKRLMLMGLAAASLAAAEAPQQQTSDAPPRAPHVPAPARRTEGGTRINSGPRPAIRINVEFPPRGAGQAGGGLLTEVAWVHACGGLPADSSPRNLLGKGFRFPGPGRGFPDTSDYYPPQSVRLRETGVVTVRACIGTDGFLTVPPAVERSSGSANLDAGALNLAIAGNGKYVPAKLDGKPVEAWLVFRVTFVLDNVAPVTNGNN